MSTLIANRSRSADGGSSRLLILLCVSVPSFMINLDANIVAVSLPSISRALGADFTAVEWVVSAYTLTFASLVMPAGALADLFGRKRMLMIGLAIFTVASLLCGAAGNVAVLNAARALQGVGAALQLSAALAILSHEFRGAARARAFAFWGSVIGVATALGPVVGGLITQHLGWQWAFYVNIPIGIVMLALTAKSLTESRHEAAGRLDIPGVTLFAGSLFFATLGLISANERGWEDATVLGEMVGAVLLFIGFLIVEMRQVSPMLDLAIFRNRTYVGACVAGLAFAASLLTLFTYLPMYFQRGLGVGAQTAGLLMLPMALPLFLMPRIVSTYLTHRLSGRVLLTIGLLLVAAGNALMASAAPSLSYGAMVGGMLLAGIGAGTLNGETAKVAMSAIPPERAGMASGLSGTVRFSGIVLGFASLGAVMSHAVAAELGNRLPQARVAALTLRITAGDLSGGAGSGAAADALQSLARQAFGHGFQALLFAAAGAALLCAAAGWWLVESDETAPLPRPGADGR